MEEDGTFDVLPKKEVIEFSAKKLNGEAKEEKASGKAKP